MSVEKTVEELQRVVAALPDNGSQTTITTKTTLRAGKVVTVQVETTTFTYNSLGALVTTSKKTDSLQSFPAPAPPSRHHESRDTPGTAIIGSRLSFAPHTFDKERSKKNDSPGRSTAALSRASSFTNPRPRFVGLPGSTERVVISPARDLSPRLTLIQRSTDVKSPEQKQQIQVKLEERFPSPRPRFIGLPHPESRTMEFADLQSTVQLQSKSPPKPKMRPEDMSPLFTSFKCLQRPVKPAAPLQLITSPRSARIRPIKASPSNSTAPLDSPAAASQTPRSTKPHKLPSTPSSTASALSSSTRTLSPKRYTPRGNRARPVGIVVESPPSEPTSPTSVVHSFYTLRESAVTAHTYMRPKVPGGTHALALIDTFCIESPNPFRAAKTASDVALVGALVGADLVIKADFDPMTGKYHDLDGVGIVSAINIPASNVAEKSKFPTFFTSEGLKNHLLLAPGVKESEILRARSALRWICEHISYQFAPSASNQSNESTQPLSPAMAIVQNSKNVLASAESSQSADSVLKRQTALPEGFATLFETLCRGLGLECVTIRGVCKPFSLHIGAKYNADEHPHCWNAVKINGIFRLVDVCWATGTLNATCTDFSSKFDAFWFLVDPNAFIFTHFPVETPWWQLLSTPLTFELFCALPRVHAPFWRAGLSCSHHQLSYCQLDEHNGRLYCVKQGEPKSSAAKHGIELAFSSLETVQPDWVEVQCSPPSEFSVDAKGSRLRIHADFAMAGTHVLSVTVKNRMENLFELGYECMIVVVADESLLPTKPSKAAVSADPQPSEVPAVEPVASEPAPVEPAQPAPIATTS